MREDRFAGITVRLTGGVAAVLREFLASLCRALLMLECLRRSRKRPHDGVMGQPA
jgi:hypothetical protein